MLLKLTVRKMDNVMWHLPCFITFSKHSWNKCSLYTLNFYWSKQPLPSHPPEPPGNIQSPSGQIFTFKIRVSASFLFMVSLSLFICPPHRRKAMTNLDSILKGRDITLLTKVHLVKATVFPVVMYGCESWTIKKAEHWRINAFELCCWRRPLRVPWTARKSNQSILKEISPEYSLEGLMLKLRLQYFGLLMRRTDSLEKTLMLGKIEEGDDRRWDGWMASLTRWTWVWASSGSWWWTGKPGMLPSIGVAESQTQLSDWTDMPTWDPYPICLNLIKTFSFSYLT